MNYYGLLVLFRGNGMSRKNFLRHHTQEELDDILMHGFVIEYRKTDIDDPVYIITNKGRTERDRQA